MQIEDFIKHHRLDILHLQEVDVHDDAFECCPVISSCFTIIPNNSPTQYGTASLVKNEIVVENVQAHNNWSFSGQYCAVPIFINEITTENLSMLFVVDCKVIPKLEDREGFLDTKTI